MKRIILPFLLIAFQQLYAHQPSFKSYQVPIYKGRVATLKIKGNKLAKMYRTVIMASYYSKERRNDRNELTGLNFAGHYCLVYWGCGSDCQQSAVVDLKTGLVYDGPTAANLFEYRPDSRLLNVNQRGKYKVTCAFCKPEYWLWSDNKRIFIRLK